MRQRKRNFNGFMCVTGRGVNKYASGGAKQVKANVQHPQLHRDLQRTARLLPYMYYFFQLQPLI